MDDRDKKTIAFDADALRKESVNQGAKTGEALLAGLPGSGTLQVWRGQSQDIIRILGTWRQANEVRDQEALRQALEQGRQVEYEGPLEDPANAGDREIRTKVTVSSVAWYRRDAGDGSEQCFVNFVPHDPSQVAS